MRAIASIWILWLTAVLLWPGPVQAVDEGGMELSTPVRQQLRLLHEAWQSWTRAYYEGDGETASTAVERLQAITQYLGMSRLPDLAAAAATFAVSSARDGDFERAQWALESARQLDTDRPETEFAAAAIRRHQGDYIGAISSTVQGYLRLFRLPIERQIWLQNIAVWVFLVLFLSGGCFVALQFVLWGRALYEDLAGLLPQRLPTLAADLLVLVLLLWPLLLPSGLFWLALYWSVLLWGYGSVSERVVLVALWLLLAATPLVLSVQQRSAQVTLAPPARTVDNVAAGRLYGGLFSDLGVLRTLIPESAAVLELVADLHRRFDQWDQARTLYTTLAEDTEQDPVYTAAPLTNLGLFHLRRKDYGTAVAYFERATKADGFSAEAYFNLSRAFSQLYDFSRSNGALEEARRLNREGVDAWLAPETPPEESGVAVDGGVRRVGEIRQELRSAWQRSDGPSGLLDLWRRHFSLSIVVVTILLAVALHLLRRQLGEGSYDPEDRWLGRSGGNRWLRALVPGLRSALHQRGGRAFLGILLPVSFAMLPVVRGFGYRTPLGFDPGSWLPVTICFAALALLLAARLAWEFVGER